MIFSSNVQKKLFEIKIISRWGGGGGGNINLLYVIQVCI